MGFIYTTTDLVSCLVSGTWLQANGSAPLFPAELAVKWFETRATSSVLIKVAKVPVMEVQSREEVPIGR